MDGIYRLLVKTTLVVAVLFAIVTLAIAFTVGTPAVAPMTALAVAAAAYSGWRIREAPAEITRSRGRHRVGALSE